MNLHGVVLLRAGADVDREGGHSGIRGTMASRASRAQDKTREFDAFP